MKVSRLTGGGAPFLGEPLSIELANATFMSRGVPRDGLRTPEHLAAWLRDARPRLLTTLRDNDLLAIGARELATARELRDAVRDLAAAVIDRRPPDPLSLTALNRQTHDAPRWRYLHWDQQPYAETRTDAPAVSAALAEIADDAIDLLTGPARASLRACHAPGCVLYFVKSHGRREWCSTGCGNRVRAARHYERIKAKTTAHRQR